VLGNSAYDVYGGIRTQSGFSSTFGFTGQQTDPTGLLFLRARYLDPTLGRFLSADTVEPNAPGTQGFDAYSYVAGRPTTESDPSGNFAGIELGQLLRNTVVVVRALVPIAEGAVTREQLAQCIVIASAAAVAGPVAPVPSPCAKAGALIRLFLFVVLSLAVATIPSDTQQATQNGTQNGTGTGAATGTKTGTQPSPQPGTPSPPKNSRRACAASEQDVESLKARAVEVQALKTVWYQTVADLRTYELLSKLCMDIVGAGKSNLNQAQKANVIAHNEIPVTVADRHAEVTVLNRMPPGTIPLLLGMSQPACLPTDTYTDSCRLDINNNGGELTPDEKGAIFRANIAIMFAGG
jgi:RHS repeat-associated protein